MDIKASKSGFKVWVLTRRMLMRIVKGYTRTEAICEFTPS